MNLHMKRLWPVKQSKVPSKEAFFQLHLREIEDKKSANNQGRLYCKTFGPNRVLETKSTMYITQTTKIPKQNLGTLLCFGKLCQDKFFFYLLVIKQTE